MEALLTRAAPPPGVTAELMERLATAWAPSTWQMRESVWRRFQEFASGRSDSLDRCAAEWVVTLPGVKDSTRLTYAKHLLSLLKAQQVSAPTTTLLCRALERGGATTPTAQATPATRLEVDQLRALWEEPWGVALFILWKSASRWDDVRHLQREHFLRITPTEIIIRWPCWKTNPQGEIRASSFVVITDPQPMTEVARYLKALEPTTPIAPWTTPVFRSKVQKTLPHLTAHSFKRGALLTLFKAAQSGRFDMWLIPRLAKHATHLHEFPATTLRYGSRGDDVALARLLGTGAATRCL